MNGDFPGGHGLQPGELSEALGISAMPVREAIKRLEALGLVEELPYRGAVVKQLSKAELLHIYAVRKMLETEATRLGAPRVSSRALEDAEDAYARMSRALERDDFAEYLDRDEEILAGIYADSGNPVLLETIRWLWARCRPFKIVGVRAQVANGELSPLLDYQRRLIDAVGARDAAGAERITAESLDAASERIKATLPDEE